MSAEYYTMTDERAEEIAVLAGLTSGQVREVALADWPEGAEHQAWLDSAPVQEIADWVLATGVSEQAE